MEQYLYTVLMLTLVSVGLASESSPTVTISQGSLVGTTITTWGGRQVYGFMAIPYAAPPVGPLRFKSPQQAPSWSGLRDASKPGNVCIQQRVLFEKFRNTVIGSEDCLILNVYTPKVSPSEKFPVMFYIHGGSFVQGSGNPQDYGPELLLDRDVVLVTISYRLGPLGFLSTGDSVLPGNLGLKDQLAALKWVQKNIGHFGGDINSVTMFGQSAGGASVHFHMLSPKSQGLFHRGISESGTALCPFAYSTPARHRHLAAQLAKLTDCPLTPSQHLVDCLRNLTAQDIVGKLHYLVCWDLEPLALFNPAIEPTYVEDAFLVSDPWTLTSNIPWMVGMNEDEGLAKAASLTQGDVTEKFKRLNEDFDMIFAMSMMYQYTASNPVKLNRKIRHYYFGDADNITMLMIPEINKLYTDSWIAFGVTEAIYNHCGPVFPYYYAYNHSESFSLCNVYFGNTRFFAGCCHFDELLNLFPMSELAPKPKKSSLDYEVSIKFLQLWTNYAKDGVPVFDGKNNIWKGKYGSKDEYLEISANTTHLIGNPFEARMQFWRSLSLRSAEDQCPKINIHC